MHTWDMKEGGGIVGRVNGRDLTRLCIQWACTFQLRGWIAPVKKLSEKSVCHGTCSNELF